MGAQFFTHVIEGHDANVCFQQLVDEATFECGHDSYNGTINTCRLGRLRTFYPASKNQNKILEEAYRYAEDNAEKWVADVLDLGVIGYDIVKITKAKPSDEKPAEYRQKYVVCAYVDDGLRIRDYKSFDKKTDADNYAKESNMKENTDRYFVEKKPVVVNRGTSVVTRYVKTTKRTKTQPKTIPANSKVFPVHKYMFYGWAAC